MQGLLITTRLISCLLLLAFLAVAALILLGKKEQVMAVVKKMAGDLSGYQEDGIVHVLLFVCIAFAVLELLHVIYAASLGISFLCLLIAAGICFFAVLHIDRHCRIKKHRERKEESGKTADPVEERSSI